MTFKEALNDKHWRKIIPKNEQFKKELINLTNFLPEYATLAQRRNYVLTNTTECKYCPICNNIILERKHGKLSTFCSKECYHSPEGKVISNEKRKKTNKERFGTDYAMQNAKLKKKFEKVCKKKYGSKYYLGTRECIEKTKQILFEKYGVENSMQAEEIKQKARETTKKHYGVENVMILDEFKEDRKRKLKKRYGVEVPMQSKEIQKKVKQTMVEKYGVDHPMKVESIKEKAIKNSTKAKRKHYNNLKDLNKQFIENNFLTKERYLLANDMAEYFNCHVSTAKRYCKEFNIDYMYTHVTSLGELEIINFIKENTNYKIIQSDRTLIKPFELDIVIKEKKLAIEFDGLYWHSYGLADIKNENANYHIDKTLKIEKKGYSCLHIFEDEWSLQSKRKIWQSILLAKLGKIKNKIYARKCKIKEVSSKEKVKFLNENHIQGNIQSPIKLGLYYNNELVSIMTFGKPRFNKDYEYELLRFCNKLNTIVVGGASKLLKYFEKNYKPKSLISYANRRFSQGNLYKQLGFKFSHSTKPNYFYILNKKRYSRTKFQKHKLKKILDDFNPNIPESINMYNNGYRRIYDCGNYTYIKKY